MSINQMGESLSRPSLKNYEIDLNPAKPLKTEEEADLEVKMQGID